MQRSATADLLKWRDDPARKPLVLNGARQVDKIWIVEDFAQEHFDNIAHVLFLDNEEAQSAFEGSERFGLSC